MHWAILDTCVYIAHWERGRCNELLADIRQAFIVRHSAVVLSELRRGARTREAQRLVNRLFRIARTVWVPTAADWWEAGKLVRQVGDREGWEVNKRREFQNDALIALTARRHGATVVTSNRDDYLLLKPRVKIAVMYASAEL